MASIGRYAISSILSSIAIEGARFPLPMLRSFNLDTTFEFFENIAHERGEGSFHVPDRASLIAGRRLSRSAALDVLAPLFDDDSETPLVEAVPPSPALL